MLPTRLAARLIPGSLASRKVAQLAKKDREYLALAIHDHMVTPSRSEGMGHAEAAAGGVDTSDVNPRTLESRKPPGLYFAGEELDVTGLLGGYNLHWAWATVGESWKKKAEPNNSIPPFFSPRVYSCRPLFRIFSTIRISIRVLLHVSRTAQTTGRHAAAHGFFQ